MNDADDMNLVIEEMCALDPSLGADLRGADDAVIARLEVASGRPLPSIYRSFLRTMGEEWGIPFPKAGFRPAGLIEYFENMSWRPPHGHTMIGEDYTGNGEDYFLDTRSSPPAVVLFPKGTDPTEPGADLSYYEWQAPSLPHFVFQIFFLIRHLQCGPNYIDASKIQNTEGASDKANDILSRMGLTPHPRSGYGYFFYVTPGASIAVVQPEGYGLGVELAGSNANEVERIFAILHEHVGLFRRPTR